MEGFELYYARLEPCAYTYLLYRLCGKQRDKISLGSYKIAIVSGDFTRVTENNHVKCLSGQPFIPTNARQGYLIFWFFREFQGPKSFLSNFWNA
jgi:hypothetical protein